MSDFLERNGLQTVAQHFKDLFLASVHRDGTEELLERLENFSRHRREPSTTALSPAAWLFTACTFITACGRSRSAT